MTSTTHDPSELFERVQRRSMVALVVITLVLGGIGLALALSPQGAVRSTANLPWWLLPIILAALARLLATARGRHFAPDSPEVKAALQDEWRRTNLMRAAQGALIVVLIGQWPLGLIFGFLTHPQLTAPRIASAMAAATIMLGVLTLAGLFFYYDRE
jgi:FtsH-binding integral membrane protein